MSEPEIAAAVTAVVERVFETVVEVRTAALRHLDAVVPADAGPSSAAPAPELEVPARSLLRAPGQLAIGLGVIAAPQPGRDLPVRLQWWQVDPETDRILALDPDLKPSSVGFYDYTTAPWFAVPRRTGERHVVGPYVDVHGTGQYLLTFTEPVVADGRFVGVAGADVPVHRFEAHLLGRLGPQERAVLLLDEERRVVVSTSPRWLVGDLVRTPGEAGPGVPVAGVPWRLHLS